MPASIKSYKFPLLLLLACAAAYGGSLRMRELYHDDQAWIASNPLLHRGVAAIPEILTSGYVEPVLGGRSPIQEYRPLLVLSFLAQTATTGFAAPPMHAANLLLHFSVCLLLWLALLRTTNPTAAAAGALAFAVLPVHAEAVLMVGWRSELMVAACVLSAWLCLDPARPTGRRLAAGAALFLAGLLTKEHAILFPFFLALADWTFHGRKPWSKDRRRVHAALGACAAAYLAARGLVLSRALHGGAPYFPSRWTAALTLPRFAFERYLWPSLTGAGLCSDFSRPLIVDARAGDVFAWACLAALAAALAAAAAALKKRRPWAFWLLGPCVFLAPTAHVVVPLDTIGAERFLYLPTIGLAAGMGWAYDRLARRRRLAAAAAAAALCGWYLAAVNLRTEQWLTKKGFYEAAVSCNPVSAKARNGLGEALISAGDVPGALSQWARAVRLQPGLAEPYYNFARLAWQRGDAATADYFANEALSRDARFPDAWVLLGIVRAARGDAGRAAECYEKALAVDPDHALAHFNLGQADLALGLRDQGLEHLERYAALAPDDPDAPRVLELVQELRRGGR